MKSLSDRDDVYRKYLDPEIVSRLSTMELRARLVVEGFIIGLHRSPYHGFSIEFAEHRQYMPGDEIRHLDWKVLGRTGRYYIKQFEEETNLKSYLLIDASRSMGYSSGKHPTKLEYASYLAAALSFLMIRQQDAVGLMVYDEKVRSYLPPHATRSYLRQIFHQLDATEPGNRTSTSASLHEIAERIRRRGLVAIFSDLFDAPEDVMTAIRHFRHKKHEVVVFHILDPMERTFAFGSDALFRDMETGEEVATQPWHLRAAYREAVESFIGYYKKECREHNVEYVLLDTTTPFDVALTSYLNKRTQVNG